MRHLIVFATKSANMVTLNSSASLGALTEIDRKSKKMIIPLGIDVAKFSPENQDPDLKVKLNIRGPFLLSVGRLVELKGLTYLIAAMKKIVADAPTAKLVVIGTGPEAEKLKKQSKELGIAQQVIFLGGIQNSELPKYYASADIFIGPSVKTDDGATESFGIVFLEALASGTAVISTDSGGIGDIVKDGVTGIVVPERNSECIYEAVQKIIAEPDFRARLRRNGLQMTRDLYSWNKVGKMFGDLYMNVHKNP
jgi:glycosyltransferase involved in cell wall biosynthesis